MQSIKKFPWLILFCLFAINAFSQSFDQLDGEIEQHINRLEWRRAEKKIEFSLANFDIDEVTKTNLYHNLGLCKLQLEDYLGSRAYLKKAMDTKEAYYLAKNTEYAKSAQLMGDLSLRIADYNNAIKYLSESQLIFAKEVGELSDENVDAYVSLGQLYEAIGKFKVAHGYFDRAVNISQRIHTGNSPEYAEVLNHIGRIYIRNGELEAAEKNLKESNKIFKSLGKDFAIPYVESLENLAMLYEQKGKFAEAERLLLNIESEKRKIVDLPEKLMLETLNDLGILYLDLDNLDRARNYFEEVKKISEANLGLDHKYYATAVNNLAAIAKEQKDYTYAKDLLLTALDIYKTLYGEVHPQYSNALNNLATVERLLENFDDAERHYDAVLTLDKQIYGEQHPIFATAVNNLGILYSTTGQFSKAGEKYKQAALIRRNALGINHPSYARSLENLGMHYFLLGQFEVSEMYLKEAIEIQVRQISTVFPSFTEKERAIFYENIREDIERYIFVAFQLLDSRPQLIQNILDFQIATKGILFSSSERIRNSILSSNDQVLIKQYKDWSDAKVRLAAFYQMGEEKLSSYGVKLSEVEASIEQMEKSLMLQSSLFEELFPKTQIGWRSIQSKLKPDEALVEIVRFREFSKNVSESSGYFGFTDKIHYLFIIIKPGQNSSPEYVMMENGASLEDKGYKLYSNSLKFNTELHTTYINFWEPISKRLNGFSKVHVSPDGVYYKMNPNTFQLLDKSSVIDHYYITYLTNSKDLLKVKQNQTSTSTANLYGNPTFGSDPGIELSLANLPGAEKEVQDLSKMMTKAGWGIQTYTNDAATEKILKSTKQPRVLHLATHGFFSDNDPILKKITPGHNPMFKSGLYLEGAIKSYGNYQRGVIQDSEDDGILSSYEAMNLNLNETELVVLSACETSLGDIEAGEGVYGLQRAFMVAGAQNVITSLSKVEDRATQLLMTYFYKEYLKNADASKALYKAQLELRSDYPSPRIWGAFLLTGKG